MSNYPILFQGNISQLSVDAAIDNLNNAIIEGLNIDINIREIFNGADTLGNILINDCPEELIKSLVETGISEKEAIETIKETSQILKKPYLEEKVKQELGSLNPFKISRINLGSDIFEGWIPLGTVLHIAPGNAPAIGFLTVIESLLCGNVSILKDTYRNGMFSLLMLQKLGEIVPELKPLLYGFHISSSQENLMEKLFNIVDGVAVWGGDGAISAIRNSVPPGVRIIEWGHKISFAYFTLNAAENSKSLEELARDICRMEQQACASPQVLYIDTDDFEQVKNVAYLLSKALKKVSPMYPIADIDIPSQAEITTTTLMNRLQQPFGDTLVIEDEELNWRILAENNSELKSSPLYRTIWIKPLKRKNIIKVLLPYRRWLQTVSLGCDSNDIPNLSINLIKAGVTRIVEPGKVFSSYPGEPHDGVRALSKYCKRVNIQGIGDKLPQIANLNELLPFSVKKLSPDTPTTDKSYFDNVSNSENSQIFVKSGGSSGKPKLSGYTWEDYNQQMQAGAEGLFAAGFDVKKDRCINLFYCGHLYGGFLSIFTVLEKLGAVQFPMAAVEDLNEVADTIINNKINTLLGMPSYIIRLFQTQEEKLSSYSGIDKIFYGGEMFNPQQAVHLKNKFGVKLIKSLVYGSNDIGPMGFACEYCEDGVHHLFTDAQILEIFKLNEDKPVDKGEIGRLLFTPLFRKGQNITRYEIGDLGKWIDGECPCGRTSPRFKLMGRYGDIFKAGTNFLNYREFVKCLSDHLGYSGLLQLEIEYEQGHEQIIVKLDKKQNITENDAYTILTKEYNDLKEVTIDEPLLELVVKCVDEKDFIRTKASDKLKAIIDNRK
jgi:phenylacetate-coenzyme A ligase PaaK-like adenylate-forming protein